MPAHLHKWESRRQDDRVATNADQAEFAAIYYQTSNIEAGTFDDRVADALDDYEIADPQMREPIEKWSWPRNDVALDNATSDIGIEVRRRREILGPAYPFQIDGNRLVYKPSRTLIYEFCLAVSQATSLNEGESAKLPVAFERLVRDVLICFLGVGTAGLRTGWPPDDRDPRAARFKEVVGYLNQEVHKHKEADDKVREWRWSPDAGLPDDPEPQDVKDEGLDLVVWKEFPDGRPGRLFLLGQCACGNDYTSKFNDIDPKFEKIS